MTTETLDKTELLAAIDDAKSRLQTQMALIEENDVNTVPYTGSWTPGQLFRHVTKSTNGIAKAMIREAKPAERDPGERIDGLRKAFLDFSSKLQSPEFIIPEEGPYEKGAAIEELDKSFELLNENANKANLTELVEGLPLGPVTKLEILHFVLFHTERHLHQMKKIVGALSK